MDQNRAKFFSGLLLVSFLAVVGAQARVQLFDRAKILERAKESSRFLIHEVSVAKRGSILTEDGKPLAENVQASQMCLNYAFIPHNADFYSDLSVASGVPESAISSISQDDRYSCFSHPIGITACSQIEKVKERWRAGGISVGPLPKRRYPYGPYAAGFIGKLQGEVPIEGLEKSMNSELAGQNGVQMGMVDRQGHFLPQWSEAASPKRNGSTITTTIDSYLQLEAAQAIRDAVSSNNAMFGTAIILNPKNGNILAMANWPSYDPDPQPGSIKLRRTSDFNAAFEARMEPGSMFKILTLGKALDSGKVTPSFTLYCPGTIYIVGHATVRCDVHQGTRAHGLVDLEHAIGESCNISAATWAMRVGRKDYLSYLTRAKLFSLPELGLPGEVPGAYDKTDPSKLLQIADMGFGQSVAVPPISLACAFAAIGNGGYRVAPRLVDKIGGVEQPYLPRTRIVSEQNSKIVRSYMEAVMQRPFGTGYALRIPGYFLAGKTGTAQIANGKDGYVSNYVGFVDGDHPKVEILIMIDHPRKGAYFGAAVAGPVFRRLAMAAIRRYQIPPNANSPHLLQDVNGDADIHETSATIMPRTSPITVRRKYHHKARIR